MSRYEIKSKGERS